MCLIVTRRKSVASAKYLYMRESLFGNNIGVRVEGTQVAAVIGIVIAVTLRNEKEQTNNNE